MSLTTHIERDRTTSRVEAQDRPLLPDRVEDYKRQALEEIAIRYDIDPDPQVISHHVGYTAIDRSLNANLRPTPDGSFDGEATIHVGGRTIFIGERALLMDGQAKFVSVIEVRGLGLPATNTQRAAFALKEGLGIVLQSPSAPATH